MRRILHRTFIRTFTVPLLVAGLLLAAPTIFAENPAGAPADTEAGQQNAQLAQTVQPLGLVAKLFAQQGLVDDLNLSEDPGLGLTPPRRSR